MNRPPNNPYNPSVSNIVLFFLPGATHSFLNSPYRGVEDGTFGRAHWAHS
jgi:hypothetical protein